MAAEGEIHVLMVSLALQGHINPMLKFANRLITKGVHVTFATTEVARHRVMKGTNAFSNTGHQQQKSNGNAKQRPIQIEFFSDGLSVHFDRESDTATFLNSTRTIGAKNLSDLITRLSTEKKFSCVIITPFVPWAVDVADEHEIPCAVLWIQPSALYAIYYRYFNGTDPFPDLNNLDETVRLPGLPTLQVRDLPSFLSNPPEFKRLVSDFIQSLDKVKWLLGSSVYELEEDTVNSMASLIPIQSIGPLVSPFMLGEEEEEDGNLESTLDMWNTQISCLEWLDTQPPSSVIYISFGSVLILKQKQVDAIAAALKKTNKSFLWVIKSPEKNPKEDVGSVPLQVLEETKGKGMFVTWSPQERVLMHKAVACFMSHCGWNSLLETLVSGVPIIACPEWTDQPTNAKLVTDVFKTGVRMRKESDGSFSAEEVERCIVEVMEGPSSLEIKKASMEIMEASKKALRDGGSSDKNIKQFISEILQQNVSS